MRWQLADIGCLYAVQAGRDNVFIGCYTRKMQRGGWVRFPKDWLTLLGDNREMFIMPDPEGGKSLLIVAADEFRKELKRMASVGSSYDGSNAIADSAVLVEIAADGRMQIPAKLLVHVGIEDVVCFSGNIRTIALSPKC